MQGQPHNYAQFPFSSKPSDDYNTTEPVNYTTAQMTQMAITTQMSLCNIRNSHKTWLDSVELQIQSLTALNSCFCNY